MHQYRGCSAGQGEQLPRPADARFVEVKIDRWRIRAEVADTPELRRKGLQHRQDLPGGCGMLFIFEEETPVTFWMKDTFIPLSIAFMKADGTITQIETMQPESRLLIPSREPARYALEVRQGWFEDHAVKPGMRAEIPEAIPSPPEPEAEPET